MRKMSEKKSGKKLSSKQKNEKKQLNKSVSSGIKKQKLNTKKLSPERGNGKKPSKENGIAGIRKQYLKGNGSCNVTFRLPKEAAIDAQVVTLVGDFNSWNLIETKMTKLKSGDFKLTLKLPHGREYRFRYLIDSSRWENDWCADKYVPNPFGCDDSLVIV